MTDSQKERINYMRLDGESYATIADSLGLSRNTVKSFCLRNICAETNEKKANLVMTGTCDQCGKGFALCPGHRARRFCSDHCRMIWWNAHRDLLKSNAKVEHTCACCGKRFLGYERQRRKYCSHACYISFRYGKEP
ncbi:MAG: RNA polymerase subunit sigma-70 [Eubacteriales bacterium]|nr:RNA polymerase subunit sigma-70 [Eubacteriales bacterium]